MSTTDALKPVMRGSVIAEPFLHDAEIVYLLPPSGSEWPNFTAVLRNESAEEYRLVFTDVDYFSCQYLSSQNIVLKVEILEGGELLSHLNYFHDMLEVSTEDEKKALASKIQNKRLKLAYFKPRVGAKIAFLFEAFEIFRAN